MSQNPNDLRETARALVNGVVSTAERPLGEVDNPATGEILGWYELSNKSDVDAAVEAADQAWPGWASLHPSERATMMRSAAEAIAAETKDLSETLIREVGKPLAECLVDVNGGVYLLRAFADLAEPAAVIQDLTGREGTAPADEVLLQRKPLGPVAVITPWNTPIYLCLNCVAPALAAGCTVVVKPAEAAPLALTRALQMLAAALPAGVLNIVQGRGDEAGDALTSHPKIRGISFVGGVVAGRKVLESAAATIKKTSLELGGNDPAIVLEDANLDDETLREIVAGAYAVSGQICFNIKRIYVHESRFEEFVDKFRTMVDQLVLGPGHVPGVHFGPMTTEGGYKNALRLLGDARAAGATVHEGGVFAAEADVERGRYIRPAVVTGIDPGAELVIEEQFAPIIPVLPFATDDDAVVEANRTEYGLASSVWSSNAEHARAVALRIEAGNTFINGHRVGTSVPLVPFGGFKQSGLGRNHMMYAINECTEEHGVIRYTSAAAQIPRMEAWGSLDSAKAAR
ncbi:aldehyde dehydrogenase family protein [Arthrobacter sp. KNU40]|uniref:aldehyde dehydrogenase family protein n=1 Tax=Arthrobacter sp. KNU40 TaxID=3447965 RepID=UPI003F60CC3E